jgi:hypothetical protein
VPHLMTVHATSIPIAPDRPVAVSIRLQTAILRCVAGGQDPRELGAPPAELRRARARLVEMGLLQ